MVSGTLAVNINQVAGFLQATFGDGVSGLDFLGAGMFSQAFLFNIGEDGFIIRLNSYQEDFLKDQFAYQVYSATGLPVPEFLQIGEFREGVFYAITRRCEGATLDSLDELANRRVTPALFEALAEIHNLDVSNMNGWGLMDADWEGLFPSWEVYLRSFYNQKFSFEWHQLLEESMLERDIYEGFLGMFDRLIPFCPQTKWLVHGDYGFDNLVSDGYKITGVLDWAEAMLGDYVYDIANLDFWSKDVPYGKLWQKQARARGVEVPYFEERMRCYMLRIGLSSLAIAALTDDCRSYLRVKERTRSVSTPGRRSSSDWTQEVRYS